MFFKHMKDDKGEWNAGGLTPIRIKLQKGAFKGLKNDLYATIEWFYFHGTGEEHGKSTQPNARVTSSICTVRLEFKLTHDLDYCSFLCHVMSA
jgi:hypothetical protein